MLLRLLLLLGIAAGLVLFTLSNWTPAISLTFAGLVTPALPLALWVLAAIAAGILTSLLLTALFSASNYFAVREARAQMRFNRSSGYQPRPASPGFSSQTNPGSKPSDPEDEDEDWKNWEAYERAAASQKPTPAAASSEADEDDWASGIGEDWEEDSQEAEVDRPQPEPTDRFRAEAPPTSGRDRSYEARQTPRTSSRSGSVYSYGYRDPKGTGVGRTESVVDAEFRVIVPPYNQPVEDEVDPDEESADDWFDEDAGDDWRRSR